MTTTPHTSNGCVPWTIWVVEHNFNLKKQLCDCLQSQGHQVQGLSSLGELLQALVYGRPDLLVLSLDVPDGNGLYLMHDLKPEWNVPVLVMGAGTPAAQRIWCLANGADDFLDASCHAEELVARVGILLRRVHASSRVIYHGKTLLDVQKCRISTEKGYVPVTEHETRLLEYLLQNPDRLIQRDVLEYQIYGAPSPQSNSLEARLSCLRKKLRQVGSHLNIRALRNKGYMLTLDAPAMVPWSGGVLMETAPMSFEGHL